ncbi:hypothetical protein CfE428DRAFT_3734 [Chthoniobacter flavus Ellin428]|uniref:Uncharacterized protein n=1 Tax=Chthoniobacter flavus Ellin428 TaxID=497964 RepID=B4D496_9BACT|nr:hypothetical protein [Chthoniobacter flavus]EDY18697.1 hypothetical protein CfE428DRAFT_3734 [Chthoniobacter flavus Ellin428]TCO89064.1 hypothetical protein EV701_11599 [Chthoniobacter flavus]
MSSPTQPASFPDPLPDELKAMLELNRDAQSGIWGQYLFLNIVFWLVAGFLAAVIFHSHLSPGLVNALFPCFLLQSALIGLQGAAERRAQRRLQLLLTVIRGMQHRKDAASLS